SGRWSCGSGYAPARPTIPRRSPSWPRSTSGTIAGAIWPRSSSASWRRRPRSACRRSSSSRRWSRRAWAIARAPRAIDAWRALARISNTTERWRELAAVLVELADLAPTPADAVTTATQLARLEADTLERPERAIAAWKRVVAAGAASDEALAALAALYARTDQRDERRRAIEARAELAERERRAEASTLLAEAAAAAIDDGDSAGAGAWYERVVALEPQHAVAQAYLESTYRERGDWRALVSLLAARAKQL